MAACDRFSQDTNPPLANVVHQSGTKSFPYNNLVVLCLLGTMDIAICWMDRLVLQMVKICSPVRGRCGGARVRR